MNGYVSGTPVVDFEDYKRWVARRVNLEQSPLAPFTLTPETKTFLLKLNLAAMGLAGESGEVVDVLKKVLFHGKPLEAVRAKLYEEMGDILWYFALLCEVLGVTMGELIERNIAKLVQRDGVDGSKFHEARNGGAPPNS